MSLLSIACLTLMYLQRDIAKLEGGDEILNDVIKIWQDQSLDQRFFPVSMSVLIANLRQLMDVYERLKNHHLAKTIIINDLLEETKNLMETFVGTPMEM